MSSSTPNWQSSELAISASEKYKQREEERRVLPRTPGKMGRDHFNSNHLACIYQSLAPPNVQVLQLQALPTAGKEETAQLELEKTSGISKQ